MDNVNILVTVIGVLILALTLSIIILLDNKSRVYTPFTFTSMRTTKEKFILSWGRTEAEVLGFEYTCTFYSKGSKFSQRRKVQTEADNQMTNSFNGCHRDISPEGLAEYINFKLGVGMFQSQYRKWLKSIEVTGIVTRQKPEELFTAPELFKAYSA